MRRIDESGAARASSPPSQGAPEARAARASVVSALLLAVVALSGAVASVPGMLRVVRRAADLARLPYDDRRAYILGPLYPAARAIGAALPPGEPVAIVLRRHADGDLGIYVNYYLHPRPTRMYYGLDAYRADPNRARHIAAIDRERAWDVRLT